MVNPGWGDRQKEKLEKIMLFMIERRKYEQTEEDWQLQDRTSVDIFRNKQAPKTFVRTTFYNKAN